MTRETQQTISLWGLETFGPRPTYAIAARANVEMAELVSGLAETPTVEIPEDIRRALLAECADVLIMLYQVADRLGGDLHEQVDAKMAICRRRLWGRTATGKAQHVTEFKEPGTGLTMKVGRWYVVGDSGHHFNHSEGFETAEDAIDWTLSDEGRDEGCAAAVVARYDESTGGFPRIDGCNVMLADDLYKFWTRDENADHFAAVQILQEVGQ